MKIILLAILATIGAISASYAQGPRRYTMPREECPEGSQIRIQKGYPSNMTDCEVLDAEIAADNRKHRRPAQAGPPPIAPAKAEDPAQHQINEDSKIGYSTISFDEFDLEQKQLVASGKKIAIVGYVRRIGSIDTLFPTEMKAFYVGQAPTAQIPLLTEDSPRDIREYFLKCSNAGSQFGCWSRIRGRASTCGLTSYGVTVPKPCFVVEGGWRLNLDN